jgi:hypothetical protein
MPDQDIFGQRGRALEEEYFRKKNKELLEKLQRAGEQDQSRRELGATAGTDDPEVLKELEALGFTPETVTLLPLVPLVQMAWAEGGVTDAERTLLMKLARQRGIAEGTVADRQLASWLTHRPSTDVFARATPLIGAMLGSSSQAKEGFTADDLVRQCEAIAAASGGMFGIRKISADERALLASIAADLKQRTS